MKSINSNSVKIGDKTIFTSDHSYIPVQLPMENNNKLEVNYRPEKKNEWEAIEHLALMVLNQKNVDKNKLRPFRIYCSAKHKSDAEALRSFLSQTCEFYLRPVIPYKKIWLIEGGKLLLTDQIKRELVLVKEAAKLHSADFYSWEADLDE